MENDPFVKDDQSIIWNVKDKGLVIITDMHIHTGIIILYNMQRS